MKTLTIDGREMTAIDKAHRHLAERLSLPGYYGHNLDALHDCLGEVGEPTRLVLLHARELSESLGTYATAMLKTLRFSAEENPNLTFVVEEEELSEIAP